MLSLPPEVGLEALAASLAGAALSSLSLRYTTEFAEDPLPLDLQHLAPLGPSLERLALSGWLRREQRLPAALSRLTLADFSRNLALSAEWSPELALDLSGATALQHLDLNDAGLTEWPTGLQVRCAPGRRRCGSRSSGACQQRACSAAPNAPRLHSSCAG